jgi:hypothetical protein
MYNNYSSTYHLHGTSLCENSQRDTAHIFTSTKTTHQCGMITDVLHHMKQPQHATHHIYIRLILFFSLRDNSDFYIWPDDRVKILKYVSSHSWFLNIYLTPIQPTPTI